MSEPTVAREPAPPEARRRKMLLVAGVLALVAAVGVAAVLVLHRKVPPPEQPPPEYFDERLRDSIAEADRLDPGWRFADLEAAREKVSDEQNAAPLVMASAKLIPEEMNGFNSLALRALMRKGPTDAKPREQLEPVRAMLFEARKLAGFSRGRHAVKWNANDPLATPLPHVGVTGDVADLLALDAEVLAHEGKGEEALASARAALVAVHTIGDEPMLVSQVQRLAWQDRCAETVEEVLQRGQGSEEKLLALQRALEAEAAEPVLRTLARAERAGLHSLMTALERDGLSRDDLPLLHVRAEGVRLLMGRRRSTLEAVHAWLVDYTTRLVEIAGRPTEEQPALLKELAARPAKAPPEAMPLLRALPVVEIGETCQKVQARLRCAAAAVAVERYRLANGRWPDELTALVPKYLDAVPADPYDGKPLRYAPGTLDVTVFSEGPVAFRLSSVEARGKPKRASLPRPHP
jgi:hypothetical protein